MADSVVRLARRYGGKCRLHSAGKGFDLAQWQGNVVADRRVVHRRDFKGDLAHFSYAEVLALASGDSATAEGGIAARLERFRIWKVLFAAKELLLPFSRELGSMS